VTFLSCKLHESSSLQIKGHYNSESDKERRSNDIEPLRRIEKMGEEGHGDPPLPSRRKLIKLDLKRSAHSIEPGNSRWSESHQANKEQISKPRGDDFCALG